MAVLFSSINVFFLPFKLYYHKIAVVIFLSHNIIVHIVLFNLKKIFKNMSERKKGMAESVQKIRFPGKQIKIAKTATTV